MKNKIILNYDVIITQLLDGFIFYAVPCFFNAFGTKVNWFPDSE